MLKPARTLMLVTTVTPERADKTQSRDIEPIWPDTAGSGSGSNLGRLL